MKECVASILSQTLQNFNLIVLDNNSSDGTREWIESLGNNKIILHSSSENLSIEQNWSRIKDVPKNEFMTMIGHDDILHESYLHEMDSLITRYPEATLYQTHFDYIDQDGKQIRNCKSMVEIQKASDFLHSQMSMAIDSTGTGYMMRSVDFDHAGGMPTQYPNLIFADYHLWITLMLPGYKATSQRKCFSYRVHQSISRITNGMAYQHAFQLYVRFLSELEKGNKEIEAVVHQSGKQFLMYYCEAMSHRLLKTPKSERSITVSDFISQCKNLAISFIPGQHFEPMKRKSIWISAVIDRFKFTRIIFLKIRGR